MAGEESSEGGEGPSGGNGGYGGARGGTTTSDQNGVATGVTRSTTDAQGNEAPPGYHYMPDGTLMSDIEHEALYRAPRKLNSIKVLNIATKNISPGGELRNYIVKGDPGAGFYVSVKKGTDDKFYNDTTKTFASTSKPLKKFIIGSSGISTGNIMFPRVSADETYVVSINKVGIDTKNDAFEFTYEVNATDNTRLDRITGKKIYQYIDRTTTFSITSAESHWETFPSNVTITRPYNSENYGYTNKDNEFDISWTVTMDAGGMVIGRQPLETDFESATTTTVLEAVSSDTVVKVSDNSKIIPGMTVSGSGVSGTPTVASVETTEGFDSITLSASNSISKDVTLTFRGGGSVNAEAINGSSFTFSSLSVALQDVTTAVDGVVSASTAVVVDSVAGLIASSTTYVSGIGVVGSGCTSTTSSPHIDSINSGTKTLTLSDAQTLEDNMPLTITGSSRVAIITATCTMNSVGDADLTIQLDLDNFLTQTS